MSIINTFFNNLTYSGDENLARTNEYVAQSIPKIENNVEKESITSNLQKQKERIFPSDMDSKEITWEDLKELRKLDIAITFLNICQSEDKNYRDRHMTAAINGQTVTGMNTSTTTMMLCKIIDEGTPAIETKLLLGMTT